MSQNTNLKEIERKANQYHGDGLIDIAIGFVILLAGIAEIFDQTSLAGIWVVLWLPIMISAKKSITVPRMRYIDFTPKAQWKVKLVIVTVVLAVAVLFTLGLVVFTKNEILPPWLTAWLREYSRMVWPAALVGVGWLIALATGVKRLYAYAALAVIAFASGYWFNFDFPLLFTLLGAVIVLSGIVVLVRFMRKYPVLEGRQSG
ncbi:MAG: hypothetical protein ACETWR_19230 [Anaerolineae bacterium]